MEPRNTQNTRNVRGSHERIIDFKRTESIHSSLHPCIPCLPWFISLNFRATSLLTFLVLLFLTPLVLSQEKSSATVEFRVTRFDPGDGKPPEFRAGQGADAESFGIPLTYIAGPFKATLRDDTFLDLWRGNGEQPEISLRLAPAERTHLLLAFVPEGETFRVLKIQTPPDRIGGGDRLVVNATTGELAFKLGGMKPLHVVAGKSGVLKGPSGKEIVSLPALISRKKAAGWELASSEQWPCDPRFRKILFAYICPRHQHLAFHAVSERL